MIGAMKQPQIWKKFRIFCVLGLLAGCSSFRLAPNEQPKTLDSSFLAMGARWQISVQNMPKSVDFSEIKTKVMALALLYENTFSGWSDDSELRRLEKNGLHKKQIPSTLFWAGLELSQMAYMKTNKNFDITVGDRLWKVRDKVLGQTHLRMEELDQSFYFTAPVKRLTFGGIAKGMALGDMAELLLRSGIKSFRIDAGGGNIVESALQEAGKKSGKNISADEWGVKFTSKSRGMKAGSRDEFHIFDPKDAKVKVDRSIVITCETKDLSRKALRELGALSDALSTALLLDPELKLPLSCRKI